MDENENHLLSCDTDEYPLRGYGILGRNDEGYFDDKNDEEDDYETLRII